MTTANLNWDSYTVPCANRFDHYVECVCRAFSHLEPTLLGPKEAFHARVEHFEVDGAGVTRLAASNYISKRTYAGIARSESEDFFLNYVVTGSIHVEQGNKLVDVSSGGIFILNNARPFQLTMRPGGFFQSTIVRMGRPQWLTSREASLLGADSVLSRHSLLPLLKMNLATMSRGSSLSQADRAAFFGHSTMRLTELMLNDEPEDVIASHSEALKDLICIEIDRNLWDPDFSLSQLSRNLKIPIRRVQRLLADSEMSFSSYLRERRLVVAAAKLSGRSDKLKIETIAAGCGFRDLSTFYRSFKRRYGINPGELRRG